MYQLYNLIQRVINCQDYITFFYSSFALMQKNQKIKAPIKLAQTGKKILCKQGIKPLVY
jgi:hypothetical protein